MFQSPDLYKVYAEDLKNSRIQCKDATDADKKLVALKVTFKSYGGSGTGGQLGEQSKVVCSYLELWLIVLLNNCLSASLALCLNSPSLISSVASSSPERRRVAGRALGELLVLGESTYVDYSHFVKRAKRHKYWKKTINGRLTGKSRAFVQELRVHGSLPLVKSLRPRASESMAVLRDVEPWLRSWSPWSSYRWSRAIGKELYIHDTCFTVGQEPSPRASQPNAAFTVVKRPFLKICRAHRRLTAGQEPVKELQSPWNLFQVKSLHLASEPMSAF
ncbi:hypothetical protein IFM89_023918 [Coptis chinensis]|uniref:Uncharacterized protein n=1 Tax=Coptis chinensis TaxID=261450 RepID=A0A835I6P3_9MAGN|nr:hypothetical protein IFM89_023918 [Coptis chinensis]